MLQGANLVFLFLEGRSHARAALPGLALSGDRGKNMRPPCCTWTSVSNHAEPCTPLKRAEVCFCKRVSMLPCSILSVRD
ncbi:uncharacterized protein LOC143651758 isoform X3 [Tamandua tetradactyla]|uniref:uncharacterized protein LOC143651758 isoform X3 n=1 Tax=Tamandua tetradactyla TaxID=48850 RepID=UPI004053CAFB